MLVNLIPLFLAANVTVYQNNWRYGPEIVFNAKFDGAVPTRRVPEESVMINATLSLYCRPKSKLILVCRYETESVKLSVAKTIGGSIMIDQSKEIYPEQEPENIFELDFDPNNHSPVGVMKNATLNQHYISNALAEQLKVGKGLLKTMGTMRMMENSTAGRYKVTYSVRRVPNQNTKRNDYDIIMLLGKKSLHNETMDITVTRNEDDCKFKWAQITDRQVAMYPKSSKSYARITEEDFISYTDYEVIGNEEKGTSESGGPEYVRAFIGRERVTVSLDKIIRADEPLPCNENIVRSFPWTLFTSGVFANEFDLHQHDKWLSMADGKDL